MPSTREVIQSLFDKRANLIKEEREIHALVEGRADGKLTGEEQAKADSLATEIQSLSDRAKYLLTMEEVNQETEQQRTRFESLLKAPVSEGLTEQENLNERLRTFMKAGLPDAEVWAPRSITVKMEQHDLTKGTATAGAELVPTGFVATLYQHLVNAAAVRQSRAQVLTTSSGESLLVPKTTSHGANATIVGEGVALVEADPAFGQISIGAYKYQKLMQISRELLQDSAVDITGYLAKSAGIAVGLGNGAHLVTGTGTAQPQGIANAGVAGVTGAVGTTVKFDLNTPPGADGLIDLYHSLNAGYRAEGEWIMNDLTAAYIRKLKDSTGQYVWQSGMSAGQPDRLFGRPVLLDPNMAAMGANALSVGFGDFSLYFIIRDVGEVRFERSDDFAFGNDLVSFRVIFRTDAKQLINDSTNSAVKFFKHSAT